MKQTIAHNLVFIALTAGGYLVLGKLGLALASVHPSATAVWPTTGYTFAILLLYGYRGWPGIFVGAFLVNVTTAGSVATSLSIALGNTLEGLAGVYLVNRFARGRHVFEQPETFFTFVILAAGLSTTMSATIGVTSLALGGFVSSGSYWVIWVTWWLGDLVGALVVAPLLVLWRTNPELIWDRSHAVELLLLGLATLLVGLAVFNGAFTIVPPDAPLEFLCIPIAIWAAYRFGRRAAMTVTIILSGIAIWGTIHGIGPFVRSTTSESLLLLQAFMGTIAVMALALATAIRQQQQTAQAKQQSLSFLAEAGRILATSLDYEATFRAIANLFVPTLADCCFVDFIGDDRAVQRVAAVADPAKRELLQKLKHDPWEASNPTAHVLRTGEALLLTDMSDVLLAETPKSAHHHLFQVLNARSMIIVPLVVRGQTLGAISCIATEHRPAYHQDNLLLVEEIAQRAALAIDNAQLYRTSQTAIQIRDQFISVASHELRTPMTLLLGHSELLHRRASQNNTLSSRERRSIEVIISQTTRLNRLITTLLDLSRLQTGHFAIERARIDMRGLIQQIITEIQPLLEDHTVTCNEVYGPIVVVGDEIRLGQALYNLIENAIKYSPAGGAIEIRLDHHEDIATISVTDHGIGIPQAALPQLFQRFYRATNAEEQQISGMGIGLYVVAEIVAHHGGSVTIDSREGQGSTFTIRLPLAPQAEVAELCQHKD